MDRDAKKLTANCPCSKDRPEGPPHVLKIINLADCGLAIFRVVTGNKDHSENDELLDMAGNAIVIYNSSDMFITSDGLKAALDPNSISCPRCREYLKKAETVFKNITFIDRNGLMAICDHCINKNTILKSCKKCAVAKKRFSEFRGSETTFLPSQNLRISSAPTKSDQTHLRDQRNKLSERRKHNTPVKSFESDFSVIDLGYIKSRSNKLWKQMAVGRHSDKNTLSDTSLSQSHYSEDTLSEGAIYKENLHKYHSSESDFKKKKSKVSHELKRKKHGQDLLDNKEITTDSGFMNKMIQKDSKKGKHFESHTKGKDEDEWKYTSLSIKEVDSKAKQLKNLITDKQSKDKNDTLSKKRSEENWQHEFEKKGISQDKLFRKDKKDFDTNESKKHSKKGDDDNERKESAKSKQREFDKRDETKRHLDRDNEEKIITSKSNKVYDNLAERSGKKLVDDGQSEKDVQNKKSIQLIDKEEKDIDKYKLKDLKQKETQKTNHHDNEEKLSKKSLFAKEVKDKKEIKDKDDEGKSRSLKSKLEDHNKAKSDKKKPAPGDQIQDDKKDKLKKKKDLEEKYTTEKEETQKTELDDDEQKLYKKLLGAKEVTDKKDKLDKKISGKEKSLEKVEIDTKYETAKKTINKDLEGKEKKGTDKEKPDKSKTTELDEEEQKLFKKLLGAKEVSDKKEIKVDLKSNKDAFEQAKLKMGKEKLVSKEPGKEKSFENVEDDTKHENAKKTINKDLEGKEKKGTDKEKPDTGKTTELDEDEQKLFKKLLGAKEVSDKKEIKVELKSNKDAFKQAKQKMEKQNLEKKEPGREKSFENDTKHDNAKKTMNKNLDVKEKKETIKEKPDKSKTTELDDDEQKLFKKLMGAKPVTEKKEIKVDLKSNKDAFEQAKQRMEKQNFEKKESTKAKSLEKVENGTKHENAKKTMEKGLQEKDTKGAAKEKPDKIKKTELDDEEQKLFKKLIGARAVSEKKEVKVDLNLKSNKDAFEQAKQRMEKQKSIDKLLNSREIASRKECLDCESTDKESSIHFKTLKNNPIIVEHDICKQLQSNKIPVSEVVPQETLFFKSMINNLADFDTLPEKIEIETPKEEPNNNGKGVIRYALSDRKFIDKGWTMLPVEKVVRKMNIYRMRPARPEFNWFEHNKHKGLMSYDTGEKLAELNNNGRGQWFYRNGRVALDYYDCEELHAQQRVVLYSSKEPDERGRTHPVTILATFDYLGNGVVFDHAGKIRLKYNQTEGVVLDRSLGPVSNWKWHSLNDPPVLQQVMIDTQLPYKNPEILKLNPTGRKQKQAPAQNEDMLAIEFDNFIKEKAKKLTQKFKPFQIKMKALKINDNFSLRILDQATVYLLYKDGKTNLKLNLGMILDHKEIIDTDTAEVGEVSVSAELLPAKTDSLANIQGMVDKAKRYDKAYLERELRIRPAVTQLSIDKMNASKSARPPVRDYPSASYIYSNPARKRKPTCAELYYSNTMF